MSDVGRSYRASTAARWLPRTLGAAILVASTLWALRADPRIDPLAPYVARFVVLVGALAAFVVVRAGAEVRHEVSLDDTGIRIGSGGRMRSLEWPDVERLDWIAPFTSGRRWIPAAALVDRFGAAWRLPALIADGDGLIRELLRRSGRSDLAAWAEVYRLERRMRRHGSRSAIGYATAAAFVLAALVGSALG